MIQAYFYLNSLLYAIIGIWVTTMPRAASAAMGYTLSSATGHSEFLTVYGGMTIGLSLIFFLLAKDSANALGLRIAIAFYAPVLSYRIITGIGHFPLLGLFRGSVILEFFMLIAALALYFLTLNKR